MTSCSPKGLIQNKSVTPEEMEQLGSVVFQLRGPDEKIKNSIEFWKRFAESHIEAKPATDGTLDRTAAAKAVLAKLQVIGHTLAAAERNAASGDLFYLAISYGMSLADDVHQLAIIDNEGPILSWWESVEGGRRGGENRSDRYKDRDREMAKEFRARRGRGLSDTALMAKIGATRKLKRRAAINAVKRGLRD